MNFIQCTQKIKYATPEQFQRYNETGVYEDEVNYKWWSLYSKNTTDREWTFISDIVRDDLTIKVYNIGYSCVGVVDVGERYRRVIWFYFNTNKGSNYVTFDADPYTVDESILCEFLSIVDINVFDDQINDCLIYDGTVLGGNYENENI
jgi:hypothetical protein